MNRKILSYIPEDFPKRKALLVCELHAFELQNFFALRKEKNDRQV